MGNLIWFLAGYGVGAWIAHRDHIDEGLKALEEYANDVRDDSEQPEE